MQSTPRTPALIPGKAFLHLIYDYRYLALAIYAWNTYGRDGKQADKDAINKLIPGVDVTIQDSLLLHARSLVNFYTQGTSDSTDILLEDFNYRQLAESHKRKLRHYKASIELHLLHLTSYRDKQYRSSHPTTARKPYPSSRCFKWNRINTMIATELLECLRITAKQGNTWSKPFHDLYNAVIQETAHPGSWPSYLGNERDVRKYLKKQSITV